jgi:hypothetical protein
MTDQPALQPRSFTHGHRGWTDGVTFPGEVALLVVDRQSCQQPASGAASQQWRRWAAD